ncbi:MAG: hypothetical protein HFH85_09020 [Lachnospiraceae bacterium]|nr:hypothetical protein [Lachnospiraceae bacterium]
MCEDRDSAAGEYADAVEVRLGSMRRARWCGWGVCGCRDGAAGEYADAMMVRLGSMRMP